MTSGAREAGGNRRGRGRAPKRITRYDYPDITEPRTPETGHTSLLGDEHVVTVPMDGQRWSTALEVAGPDQDGGRPLVVDIDPAVDPVLLWSGKRDRRDVPVLPLQRNEVVAESRVARIIDRAREAAAHESLDGQGSLFADLEKELREADKGKRVEFYTHDEGWKNKLICGDSLTVVESLLDYEGLRGRVQMIYVDPPYGIKYDALRRGSDLPMDRGAVRPHHPPPRPDPPLTAGGLEPLTHVRRSRIGLRNVDENWQVGPEARAAGDGEPAAASRGPGRPGAGRQPRARPSEEGIAGTLAARSVRVQTSATTGVLDTTAPPEGGTLHVEMLGDTPSTHSREGLRRAPRASSIAC